MPTRPDPCRHTRRQLYRKDFASGTGYHVVELCLDCGRNARGPGVWVARFEAPDPDALPRLPAGGSPGQPGLFDDLPADDPEPADPQPADPQHEVAKFWVPPRGHRP